jgi:hypothetical protein
MILIRNLCLLMLLGCFQCSLLQAQNISEDTSRFMSKVSGRIIKIGSDSDNVYFFPAKLYFSDSLIDNTHSDFDGKLRFDFETQKVDMNKLSIVIKEKEGSLEEYKFHFSASKGSEFRLTNKINYLSCYVYD